jgi:hypothetical protein
MLREWPAPTRRTLKILTIFVETGIVYSILWACVSIGSIPRASPHLQPVLDPLDFWLQLDVRRGDVVLPDVLPRSAFGKISTVNPSSPRPSS